MPLHSWHLWLDAAHEPALNMALDEALLESAPGRGVPLLRFYGWDRPAVTIGYVQHFTAAPASGYAIIRRPTGGGVVFHDHDFTYSVVLPAGHPLAGVDRLESYAHINRAVLAGLEQCQVPAALAQQEIPKTVDRNTMVCFKTPTRYDVLAGARKVAGSAQRRTRDGVLHQGSIHFGQELPLPRADLAEALIAGFRRTLNAEFADFFPSTELLERAAALVAERYGQDSWNRRR
jgi:lipoate-protein ligase A